jgi:hypothetical protein
VQDRIRVFGSGFGWEAVKAIALGGDAAAVQCSAVSMQGVDEL